MNPIPIAKDIYFIGVFDPDIRTFDIIMKAANGSSYNAYLIKTSEGVIVVDTVKKEFQEAFFANLEALCSYEEIRYVIVHHIEPDHSGALPELITRAPQAKVLISPQASMMLGALTHKEHMVFETVWTNKTLRLGEKTLTFLSTPYLHWPETLSTYVSEDKLLFSGDVFGAHYCDTRLFDDKVGDFSYAYAYYYDHIMRPFKRYVASALALYDRFEIACIAPLHGPILRHNPRHYMDQYRAWSAPFNVPHKTLTIFYLTSYKNTYDMAQAIMRGSEHTEGLITRIYDLAALEEANMLALLDQSDGFLIGTPTINGDAPKPVWDLLSCLMFLGKEGKCAGAFGSYGWSGEAIEHVLVRLKHLKLRVPPLEHPKVKLIPTEADMRACEAYGKEFGEVVMGKMIEMTLEG